MTNERYLVFSYFVGAAVSIGIGTLVYFSLRRPFAGIAEVASGKNLTSILKRLLPCGLVFPALLGFVSVSYRGCHRAAYDEIVQNRAYLVEKSQEQLASVFLCILVAILFWNLIAFLVLRHWQRGGNES
jgi:hypothetical protein